MGLNEKIMDCEGWSPIKNIFFVPSFYSDVSSFVVKGSDPLQIFYSISLLDKKKK